MWGKSGRTLICCASLFAALAVAAPTAAADVEGAWMFEPTSVAAVELEVSAEDWAELEAEPDEYVPAGFEIAGVGGGAVTDDAELRLKGGQGSFRGLDGKAAFKLKFPKPGLLGLRKLTLNNMVQDPSMLHERLSYELFRAAGVAAPRTGYAFVRINGEDFGLYLNVETLDKVALPRWFDSTGHLYEGSYGIDVSAAGIGGFEVDEGDEDDRADLEALLGALEAPGDFTDRMAGVADLEQMTRMWAVERYVGHWDGYTATPAAELWPNNYYLHSDHAGRFSMVPWGADQTLVRRYPFDGPGGVIFNGCLADLRCSGMFAAAVRSLPELAASLELDERAVATATLLAPHQADDPRRESTLAEIEQGVTETRAFLAARPGDVADPAYWAPRELPHHVPAFDASAPETAITRAPAPRLRTSVRRARVTFAFESSEPGSRFECRTNRAPWRECASPLKRRARPGEHAFRVRAVDLAGNVDPSPAVHRWSVRRCECRPGAG